MGEIGLNSREHIGGGKPGDSSHQFHQGTDLAGCSSLGVDNRICHVGDVVNDADTHLHADKTFLNKCRAESVYDLLSSVETWE